MKKTTKFLGIVSLVFSIFSIWIFIQYLIDSSAPDAGWVNFGFYLISLIFLFIAVILSIPFLIISFKLKFKNMKFYLFSHLTFVLLCAFLIIYSVNG